MKSLKIKNRASSPLFFVFCTISSCTCEVCMEWVCCETHPIADWKDATYGVLSVEGFTERVDRFCEKWDCVGACFFDSVPLTICKGMLFDYEEDKNYTIGDGKADMSFTFTGPRLAHSSQLKYLHVQNHSATTLYFTFCTTSACQCNVCQEWITFETIPVVDMPGWTVGRVIVDPFSSTVERFCSQWDCIGACFMGTWPSDIKRGMLFDYDEQQDYTIGGGKATLSFTYKIPQGVALGKTSVMGNGAFQAGTRNGAVGAGVGVVKAVAAAHHVYQAGNFVNDVFNGTTGPDDNGLADVLGTALEGAAGCIIS